MASNLNSEFNYRYQVIGGTPWEKIKTLQGFLSGRKRAAAQSKASNCKYQSMIEELKHLQSLPALPHVILRLQSEIMETEVCNEDYKHALELNLNEIKILEKLLAELYIEVEPTRIAGYTDDMMFEANANYEFTINVCREIQSEMIANGRPSPAKLLNAMSNPQSLEALKTLGIVPQETLLMCDKHIPMQLVDYLKLDCAKEKIPLK